VLVIGVGVFRLVKVLISPPGRGHIRAEKLMLYDWPQLAFLAFVGGWGYGLIDAKLTEPRGSSMSGGACAGPSTLTTL
jgi:hypothetical protein